MNKNIGKKSASILRFVNPPPTAESYSEPSKSVEGNQKARKNKRENLLMRTRNQK